MGWLKDLNSQVRSIYHPLRRGEGLREDKWRGVRNKDDGRYELPVRKHCVHCRDAGGFSCLFFVRESE